MLIGFDFFTGNCFDSNINSGNIYRMELQNAKIDEVKIDSSNSIQYNMNKQSWGINTLFKSEFKNMNLEAGNINFEGMPIELIRIKKRKTDEFAWQTYKDIPFDSNKTNYNWSDYFVESLENYEYAVLPVNSQGIEGQYSINSVECEYDDVFVLGQNDEQYRLIYNIELSDIETITPSSIVETLGSKYPFEISNGDIQYRKGNIKATIISNNTIHNGIIDRKQEKILRTQIYKFLTNKKPKIIKMGEGNYMLISIKSDSVKLNPVSDIGRQLYNIIFDFTEIDDVSNVDILKLYKFI